MDRALFIVPNTGDPLIMRQVEQQAAGLRQAGCPVYICALRATTSGTGIDSLVDRWRTWDAPAAWRLRKLVRRWQPQVVHVAPGDADGLAVVALWGLDCQLLIHRPSGLPGWIDRIPTSALHLLASTQSERAALVRRGADPNGIHCVTPGWDGPTLEGASRDKLTSQLEIPATAKLVGTVADLVPGARLRDVIWMGDLLKVVRDDTHVLILGEGRERLRLERFRQCVEIEDRVHFLDPAANPWSWLPHLDCYVCAAGGESIDATMIDMMRRGVPLVISDTAGHRELVRHESNGLLFPVGNRGHFARQVLRALEQPDVKQRVTSQARVTWEQRLRPEIAVEKFVAVHLGLCGKVHVQREDAPHVRGSARGQAAAMAGVTHARAKNPN